MVKATLHRRVGLALGWVHSVGRLAVRILGGQRGVRAMLAAVPRPASPAAEPWELSLASLARAHPRVPGLAARLLRRFDKYGRVTIAPDRVGFDDKTIKWSRVIEIRSYPTVNMVPSVVVDREIDRIRGAFPPLPGRRWIVAKAASGVVTAVLAFGGPQWRAGVPPTLPCEIMYRNVFGRPTTLTAGLFAAVVLAAIPEAASSLVATARAQNVPVRAVPDPGGARRAVHDDRSRRWMARVPATR